MTYNCKYFCRYTDIKNQEELKKHEAVCWNNPKNKTCDTCKENDYYRQDYYCDGALIDTSPQWTRFCMAGNNHLIIEIEDTLPSDYIHVPPVVNCPYHELKTN